MMCYSWCAWDRWYLLVRQHSIGWPSSARQYIPRLPAFYFSLSLFLSSSLTLAVALLYSSRHLTYWVCKASSTCTWRLPEYLHTSSSRDHTTSHNHNNYLTQFPLIRHSLPHTHRHTEYSQFITTPNEGSGIGSLCHHWFCTQIILKLTVFRLWQCICFCSHEANYYR